MPTILIVDDEELLLQVLLRVISRMGYKVLIAPAAEAAIDIARLSQEHSTPVDLLVTDINLGRGMDGIELAKALWESYQIPACFISGLSELPPDLPVLQKPFSNDDLHALIGRTLAAYAK